MSIFLIIIILSFVCFVIHYFTSSTPRTALRFVELLLLYQLVFNIGVLGYLSFYGLTFMQETVSQHLEWPVCPFQQELGNANLGFGTLGFLCIWFRKHFWTATIIGTSIWLFADGIGHIYDMVYNHNFSEGNSGLLMYSDLFIPLVMMSLLILKFHLQKKKNSMEEKPYSGLEKTLLN